MIKGIELAKDHRLKTACKYAHLFLSCTKKKLYSKGPTFPNKYWNRNFLV